MSANNQRGALFLVFAALASWAWAAELEVSDAWIRLVPAGAPAGGYFTVRNGAGQSVALVGASSSAFGKVMMHMTVGEKGLSRMLPIVRIEVPASGALAFAPGGNHLMLTFPTRTLVVGDRVPITLEFSDKHKITVQFEVRGPVGK